MGGIHKIPNFDDDDAMSPQESIEDDGNVVDSSLAASKDHTCNKKTFLLWTKLPHSVQMKVSPPFLVDPPS